ncbi:MAG: carotenoid biosynthesis protein [Crocinitomicaceae bacterium]
MLKIDSNTKYLKFAALALITILHIVGLFGIGVYKNDAIIGLSWVNLTFTFSLGLLFFETNLKLVLLPMLVASIIGLASEAIGVNTGYLFGEYSYGSALGFKIFHVPFTIALLWTGLNIGAKNIAAKFVNQPIIIAILAASLMVVFDWLMEPVATLLNFWNWENNFIPIFNYFTWFFVSLLIQLLWRNVNTKNDVYNSVFIIQALFFIGLNILL